MTVTVTVNGFLLQPVYLHEFALVNATNVET
jgi:hypothetical protein